MRDLFLPDNRGPELCRSVDIELPIQNRVIHEGLGPFQHSWVQRNLMHALAHDRPVANRQLPSEVPRRPITPTLVLLCNRQA
jgi:hypothetical protein